MKIRLREIQTTSPEYTAAEELLHTAFPETERRDDDAQRHNTDNTDRFHSCILEDQNGFIGIFNYWDFDTFRYCEHFAVSPHLRGNGLGSSALDAAINSDTTKPWILEVEFPCDDYSRRRIQFYQRNGFTMHPDMEYLQPPYRQGDTPLPMLLMTTPPLLAATDVAEAARILCQHVYPDTGIMYANNIEMQYTK